MRSLLMTPFRLFREDKPLRNTVILFVLTTLFYAMGATLRLVEELSLFWPLNAVMAGVFARHTFLNRLNNYVVCYVAMVLYDGLTTNWGTASFIINFSNIVFILTFALLVQRDKRRPKRATALANTLKMFNYCLLASVLCACFGAVGSSGIDSQTFWPLFADWFSEQFSTGVLVLPCMLALSWPGVTKPFYVQHLLQHLLPVVALAFSVGISVLIGGVGSLAFPLPALIWCAVRYSLLMTALLTLVTGAAEIMLMANSIINIAVGSHLQTPDMFSARLGIATMAICPIMVSVSVSSINALMRQVSLRADFDFLTQVYSRSGLYEALRKLEEARMPRNHLTVMLLDIDYFKSINDNYGHECGDKVLTSFARKVQQVVGEQGKVARMGGEEFAVLAMTQDATAAMALAENIRLAIEQHRFRWRSQTLSITVSIGLSNGMADSWQLTEAFNSLLNEADKSLYRSKKGGRNRTSAQEPSSESESAADSLPGSVAN
ncbi:diguanylate cyclase [Enterobacter sp.]|uniref:GGDEF domain-containing protein n=1 Tax=Enterobacter sp. TaxID=42895 RepID=UPI00296F9845|nr:diguanylate cyclase [Enterobacter sp.]